MNKNKRRYDRKVPIIVTDKIVLEKVTFRGQKITRQRIVKVWDIPKIITDDIGYQLMFGNQCSPRLPNTKNGMDEKVVFQNGQVTAKNYY